MTARGLALLSLLLSAGAAVGYFALLRVAAVRNRPVLYLAAFGLATQGLDRPLLTAIQSALAP